MTLRARALLTIRARDRDDEALAGARTEATR